MCGFVVLFSDKRIDKKDIDQLDIMTNIISHRGPDEECYFIQNNVYFGFRRLSIIDLEKGTQPMGYENDNYRIVFNGEIYNYIEIKNGLIELGYEFNTNSEAEVMLVAYKHYGEKFVKLLRGMFSFVIWDKLNECIFGARDPFGIKPFYYLDTEEQIYCSSELKVFKYLQEYNIGNLNKEALQNYFTFQYVPEPDTILNNIKILPAGHILKKKLKEKAEIKQYYAIEMKPQSGRESEKVQGIIDVLRDSVKTHMISDVPVASFLSGGIDSTIIAALSREINPNIKTYTVGFDNNNYSELELAKETANLLKVTNISKVVSVEEFMEEIPKIIWHMDSPVADPAAIPLYFIAKEASKDVKVILSGEGADELFGGYNIYKEPDSLAIFSLLPERVKKMLVKLSNVIPEGMKGKSFLERGGTSLEKRFVGNAKIFYEEEKISLLKKYNSEYCFLDITSPIYEKTAHLDDVTRMQYIDIATWLKGDILTKADRMTMAHSLELRVPFLDRKVMEQACLLSKEDKINNNNTKYLLREAFKEYLPKEIVNRKKLGFPVPIRVWLKDEMYSWASCIIKESETDEIINKDYVLKLLEEHRKGYGDYSRKIWAVITFMLWYKIYIEENEQYKLRTIITA
jgi:asparagine synthase (glutamine-hydrolysing)